MDLEAQLARMQEALKAVELAGESPGAGEVLGLSRAYAGDAVHFMKEGRREDAIEAFGIAWAYLDALLHLGLVRIPESFRDWFTVE